MLLSNEYIKLIYWILYIIIIIIATEIFAYFWHRYGAHDDFIPGIHDTHKIHHMINIKYMSEINEVNEDFVWILFIIIIFELIIAIGVMINIISGFLALITIMTSLFVFLWNWWIHKAYHSPNHWLNSYEWFHKEKNRHYIHHINPHKNFGIASHFVDKIMDTWIDSL